MVTLQEKKLCSTSWHGTRSNRKEIKCDYNNSATNTLDIPDVHSFQTNAGHSRATL